MAEPQKPAAKTEAPEQHKAAEAPKAEPQKPAAKTMVVALAKGYYGGQLRERGDKFEIEKDADLGGWMDPVSKVDAVRLAPMIAQANERKTRPTPIGVNVKQTPAMRAK